jgi:hypothetical protein
MTTRSVNGLVFHIHSPSLWELTSIHRDLDDGARVLLEYTGLPSRSLGGGWWLRYCIPNREPISRSFNSRDQAIALIGDRMPSSKPQVRHD